MTRSKILVVDDYLPSSAGLCHLLALWGYDVCRQATSGQEAIERVALESPGLILMDIHVNGELNGIETARYIQSRYHIPIIFTTAYSDQETRKAAQAAHPAAYFIKPLDFYRLRAMIDVILLQKRSAPENKKTSKMVCRD